MSVSRMYLDPPPTVATVSPQISFFRTTSVISSLPLDRSLDKQKSRWHIIRREWIVALRSRHKMLAANPRVVGWGPIFPVDRCYLPLSSLWFSRKTIETDATTLRKLMGASYSAARLAPL